MEHPFTLHEDNDAKVVQLSGDYSTTRGSSINELKAVFYQTGHVELHRFRDVESGEITRFNLSEEETDAFIAALETFKAAQQIKRLAEEKRVAGIVQQVRELIADTPITLEEHPATESNTLYWTISFNELEITRHASNTDALLKYAGDMKGTYEHHQTGKVSIDEAFQLAKSCPAITINGGKDATAWCVVMQNPAFLRWTHHGKELLDTVQTAKAKYEHWQQDQLIKSND